MNKMLDDVERMIMMLENDLDDPAINKVKNLFSRYRYTDKERDELSKTEIKSIERKDREITIDFHQRFCKRMREMMELPGNDMVSFAGS